MLEVDRYDLDQIEVAVTGFSCYRQIDATAFYASATKRY